MLIHLRLLPFSMMKIKTHMIHMVKIHFLLEIYTQLEGSEI